MWVWMVGSPHVTLWPIGELFSSRKVIPSVVYRSIDRYTWLFPDWEITVIELNVFLWGVNSRIVSLSDVCLFGSFTVFTDVRNKILQWSRSLNCVDIVWLSCLCCSRLLWCLCFEWYTSVFVFGWTRSWSEPPLCFLNCLTVVFPRSFLERTLRGETQCPSFIFSGCIPSHPMLWENIFPSFLPWTNSPLSTLIFIISYCSILHFIVLSLKPGIRSKMNVLPWFSTETSYWVIPFPWRMMSSSHTPLKWCDLSHSSITWQHWSVTLYSYLGVVLYGSVISLPLYVCHHTHTSVFFLHPTRFSLCQIWNPNNEKTRFPYYQHRTLLFLVLYLNFGLQ